MTYPRKLVDTPTMYETFSQSIPAGTSLVITTRCYPQNDGCLTESTVRILGSITQGRSGSASHIGVTKNGVRVVLSQDPDVGWMAQFGLDDEACFKLGFSDLPGCAIPNDEEDNAMTTWPSEVYRDGSGGVPLHTEDPMYV